MLHIDILIGQLLHLLVICLINIDIVAEAIITAAIDVTCTAFSTHLFKNLYNHFKH
jgi:hypothetical protein